MTEALRLIQDAEHAARLQIQADEDAGHAAAIRTLISLNLPRGNRRHSPSPSRPNAAEDLRRNLSACEDDEAVLRNQDAETGMGLLLVA